MTPPWSLTILATSANSEAGSELVPKIKQFFILPAKIRAADRPEAALIQGKPSWRNKLVLQNTKVHPRVVVIGVSTGGPNALSAILPQFPAEFPLPILLVQHMPPLFTRFLAERLCASCHVSVKEASQGDPVVAGTILIAPGNFHMKVAGKEAEVRVLLDQSPPQNSCRPRSMRFFLRLARRMAARSLASSSLAWVRTGCAARRS